jgi:hypothetical protein
VEHGPHAAPLADGVVVQAAMPPHHRAAAQLADVSRRVIDLFGKEEKIKQKTKQETLLKCVEIDFV